MIWLDDDIWFPPHAYADEDGVLALGGDLQPERMLLAYDNGIFPWYNEGEPIVWWSPDPRCVLYPKALHIAKSMRPVLHSPEWSFRYNTAFESVIRACQQTQRKGQDGTWINEELIQAMLQLHRLGDAVSAEAWYGNELVGGLYGVYRGNVFFGESMFARKANASKYALIRLIEQEEKRGLKLIDCQIPNDHLFRLGAELIPRAEFLRLLEEYI